MQLIEAIFTPADQRKILRIPLSFRLPEDTRVWQWTKDGNYTAKSGYWIRKDRGHMPTHEGWDIIWTCKAIPKIKNMLWRLGSDILPTKSMLVYRHIGDNSVCPVCSSPSESWQHALIECPKVRLIWEASFDNNLPDLN